MEFGDIMVVLTNIKKHIEENPSDSHAYMEYFQMLKELGKIDKHYANKQNLWLRGVTTARCQVEKEPTKFAELYEVVKLTYLFMAQEDLDSYLIYLEWNRPLDKRFYQNRRRVLLPLVKDLQDLADDKIDFLGISLPPRTGKLLADDTPVLTTQGWKNHGDLVVGDFVYGRNGEPRMVQAISKKDIADCLVTFSNGEQIQCHENHEWYLFDRKRNCTRVIETKELLKQKLESGTEKKRGHRYFYQLPKVEPILGNHKDLVVNPYVLGVWLGDGTEKKPALTLANTDGEILDEVKKYYKVASKFPQVGCITYYFENLRMDLEHYGMCASRKKLGKRIPSEYMSASLEQRLELLAGLIDTDGTLRTKENRYVYSTTNKELKDDVVALISTFGWRCSVVEYEPKESTSGIVGNKICYAIGFNPTFEIPCRVPRKQIHEFSKQRKVTIIEVKKVEPKQGNCIQVDGGVYRVGRQSILTHNSTLCIFFMSWIMGRNPDVANVMSGHSDKLTNGFYREMMSVLTDADTYLWSDVFPTVELADTSAKNETIDLGHKKRFPTFTARSIGGTLTGAVEIGNGGILYVDDLIEDLEESLNPLRLQAKYDAYLNQLKDRKKNGAKELMVGTRWNVADPLGRIAEQYEGNERYRFTVISAVDDDGHSNFPYDFNLGFDDRYYADMKASIDDATWCAKYMGKPYVREGLLFPKDELKYYNGVLPDGDHQVLCVCDVAWGGGDSLAMPIAYIFGSDVYIQDVVFSNGDKTITQPQVLSKIMEHRPYLVRFEANNGGAEYADAINTKLMDLGYHTHIESARASNQMSKNTKILQYSSDIKNWYFLDEIHRKKEYKEFMKELMAYSQTGKNPHDDAPDSLAQLADRLYHGSARVEIGSRPF